MPLKSFLQHIQNTIAGEKDNDGLKVNVYLGKEARKSIKQLKKKIPNANEEQLVGASLQLFEKKFNRITERKAKRKGKLLKNKGMDYKQIAEQLNKEGLPSPTGSDQWHDDMVNNILKE